MDLDLFPGSVKDPTDYSAGSSRLVNCYRYTGSEGPMIRNVPGLRDFATVPGALMRRMTQVRDGIYVASSGRLSAIHATGAVQSAGTIPDDPNTSIVGANGLVCIAAGGNYYTYNGQAITQISGGRLTSIGSIAYTSEYVILTEAGGREIEWTTAGDPNTRNALYFAEASVRDDRIIRAMAVGSYLWIMKERSLEVWTVAGTAESAWAPLPGATRDVGLKAFNLACLPPEAVFFVGNDNRAYLGSGADPAPVSTPAVERAIAEGQPTSCFYYEDLGHRLCVVGFADRPAWVFDAAVGEWHERAQGANLAPWDATGSAYVNGQWHLGGRNRVWRLGRLPHDSGAVMARVMQSRTIEPGGRFTVNRLEMRGSFGNAGVDEAAPPWLLDENGTPLRDEAGRFLMDEDGVSAGTINRGVRVVMQTSRDGGETWGIGKTREIGRPGIRERLLTWRALGQFRRATFRVTVTDPAEVAFRSIGSLE